MVFAALLIVGVPVLDFLIDKELLSITWPINIEVYSQIIGGVGSFILTIALVILYDQQRGILDKQESWSEADHTPTIIVEEWFVDHGSDVTFSLTNPGKGIAKNLHMQLEFHHFSGDFDNSKNRLYMSGSGKLTQLKSNSSTLKMNALEPIEFHGSPEFQLQWNMDSKMTPGTLKNKQTLSGDLLEISEKLRNKGVDALEFTIQIKYDYVKRFSNQTTTVWKGKIELDDSYDLEGFVMQAEEPSNNDTLIEPRNRKEEGD